jgi:hypothetical protein
MGSSKESQQESRLIPIQMDCRHLADLVPKTPMLCIASRERQDHVPYHSAGKQRQADPAAHYTERMHSRCSGRRVDDRSRVEDRVN